MGPGGVLVYHLMGLGNRPGLDDVQLTGRTTQQTLVRGRTLGRKGPEMETVAGVLVRPKPHVPYLGLVLDHEVKVGPYGLPRTLPWRGREGPIRHNGPLVCRCADDRRGERPDGVYQRLVTGAS